MQQLSAEEFKAKMFVKLNEEGVFNKFRALLRSELVHHLQGEDPSNVLARSRKSKDLLKPRHPLEATNWLVTEHLRRNGYDFTLSVFALESGSSNSSRVALTIGDVLTFLGVHPESSFALEILRGYKNPHDTMFLWKFLLATQSAQNQVLASNTKNSTTQTDGQDVGQVLGSTSAQAKLQLLEDTYDSMKKNLRLEEDFPLMENYDLLDLANVHSFHQPERQKRPSYHGNEMRNFNMKVDQMRIALEDQYQQRVKMLEERKKEMCDTIRQQKSWIEQELSQQRQQILNQAEKLRQQEEEWNTRRESLEKTLRQESERLQTLKGQLEDREELLKKSEAHHDQWAKEQRHHIEIIEKQKYESRELSLNFRESELKVLTERLTTKLGALDEKERQYATLLQNVVDLKAELANSKCEAQKAYEENALLKDKLKSAPDYLAMMKELQGLRDTLQAVKAKSESDRTHHHAVVLDVLDRFALPSQRITSLEAELDRLREKCRLENDHFTTQIKYLENVVKESEMQKSELLKRLQNQSRESAELHKTIDHLRTKLLWSIPENRSLPGVLDTQKLEKEHADSLIVDSHVTYFDTSFTPEHLPPELKLGASRNSQFNSLDTQNNTTPKLPYHPAIELDYDESRSRIKMLEEQAEALKQKYCLMKRRLSSGRQRFTKSIHFEDELPEWKYKSSSRLSDSADSFPKFMSATVSANPQEVSVVDASFSKLWTDDRQIISGLIPESGFSDTAEYAENSLMAVREVASTPLVRPRLMSEISSFRRLNFELNNEQVLSEKDVWINSPLNQDKFSFSSQMLERKIEEMDVLQPLSSNSFKRDKFKLNLSSLKPQHMDDFTANVESATPEIHPNIDKEIPLESISKYFTSATITKPDGLTDKETVDKDIDVHEVVEDNDITFPTQVNLDAAWNASHGTMKMKDVDQSPLRMQTLTTNKKSTEPGTELLSKHLINLKPEEPRLSGRSSQISVTHEEINPAQVIKTASFVSSEKMIKEPLEIRPDLDALWKSTNEKLKLSDKNEEQQVNRSSGELPAVMKSMAVIEAADPSKDEMKERTVETNLLKEVPLVLPLLNSTHSASVKLNDATDKETFDRDKFSTMQDALSEENMLISPVQAQLNLDAAWKGSRNKKEINVGGENKFGQLDTPIGLPSHSEAIRSETEVKNSQVYQVSDIAAKGIDLSPLGDEHSDDQISWEKSGVASPNDDFEW